MLILLLSLTEIWFAIHLDNNISFLKFLQSERFPKQALGFPCLQYKSLKTLWEKEKLLVTSNFSFSHSVFYPLGKRPTIWIKVEIVVCKLFQFKKLTICRLGKG